MDIIKRFNYKTNKNGTLFIHEVKS